MSEITIRRISLPTGVTLNVAEGGTGDPIIFLHGFPESHRTWRFQLEHLSRDHRVVAPDQRGFGLSDKPEGVAAYKTERVVEDLVALADALDIHRFTLAGHDWGGAVAWAAALARPDRIARLIIVNAPHPLVFQKSLIEDAEQRAASQYITLLRNPGMEDGIRAMGLETFFDKVLARHVDEDAITAEERERYIEDWGRPGALTAMLNWYRAASIVVPAVGEEAAMPAWVEAPFPRLAMPVLVAWGLKDKALLPVQLGGIADEVPHARLAPLPEAGHFAPWEAPEPVTRAIRDFLAETGTAG